MSNKNTIEWKNNVSTNFKLLDKFIYKGHLFVIEELNDIKITAYNSSRTLRFNKNIFEKEVLTHLF